MHKFLWIVFIFSLRKDDLIYSAAEAGSYDAIVIMDGRSTIFEESVPFRKMLRFKYVITLNLDQKAVTCDGGDMFPPWKPKHIRPVSKKVSSVVAIAHALTTRIVCDWLLRHQVQFPGTTSVAYKRQTRQAM